MKTSFCPGAANVKGIPTLKVKTCPQCGAEVGLFSSDVQVACTCGFTVYNNIQSCIQWCAAARECVGEELYMLLREQNNDK